MSNETKWTRGPWHYTEHGCVKGGEFQKYERGEAQQQVALATARDDGKQESNGRLMAAAPDGAALAELVMELCGNPKGLYEAQQDELYETALQFMKKARGETS